MSAPVKHTCPDIDACVKRLKSIITESRRIEDDRLRKDIEWEADYVVDELEKLRKANGALRDWGEELEKELQDAQDEIYFLNEESKQKELNHE
jgi:uncharacterized protein (DUF3084 family)